MFQGDTLQLLLRLSGGGKRGRATGGGEEAHRRGLIVPFHGEVRPRASDGPQLLKIWGIKEINIPRWIESKTLEELLVLDALVDKNAKT